MKAKIYHRDVEVQELTSVSCTISSCKLSVIDYSGVCSDMFMNELVECMKAGLFEWRLNRLRHDNKRLQTEEIRHGNMIEVIMTKIPWWKSL